VVAHRLIHSGTFPVPPDAAFEHTLTAPLDEILGRRHLVIPAIARVEGDGPWGSAGTGQERTLHLGDGGRLLETLTLLDAPRCFGYHLDVLAGPMRLLAVGVDGAWSFEPAGTGTRITWTWDVDPANAAGRLAMPAFGVAWRGAAQRAFRRLEDHLLHPR
jgi:hypothetical protein